MSEKTPAELEAENQAREAAEAETKAKAEADAAAKKAGEEKEDYYKSQLTQLQESLDKQKEIVEHKNRAIDSLKKGNDEKLDEIRKSLRDELATELKTSLVDEVKDFVWGDRLDTEIAKYANANLDAAKLIKIHYEKIFKNSELHVTLADKVKAAALSVNQDLILNIGVKEGMETKREEVLATFSAPGSSSSPCSQNDSDPVFQMLKQHRPEALKNPKVLERLKP